MKAKSFFLIVVDNTSARSHNVNIDLPSFQTLAFNKEEAVGKMILSDWPYRNKEIYKIIEL